MPVATGLLILIKSIIKAIKNNNEISRVELARIAEFSGSIIKRWLKVWNIAWLGHPKAGGHNAETQMQRSVGII